MTWQESTHVHLQWHFYCTSVANYIGTHFFPNAMYSETFKPFGRAKSDLDSEVSSFQAAIYTENSSLGPKKMLFHIMS
jgi:hypothetical protein